MTILTVLKTYAEERLELPPSMYGENTIAWLIELDDAGNFRGITPLKSKEAKRGQRFVTPHVGRTSAVKPKLLADTAEYVLGIRRPRSTSKPELERAEDCYHQFVALVKSCAENTQEPSVQAISKFYESANAVEEARQALQAYKDFDAGEGVTFRIGGQLIPADARANLYSIEQFWQQYTGKQSESENGDDNPTMTCLVTGKKTVVAKRMPFMIKGLLGGKLQE